MWAAKKGKSVKANKFRKNNPLTIAAVATPRQISSSYRFRLMHVKAMLSTISSFVRPISKFWKTPLTARLQREHVGNMLFFSLDFTTGLKGKPNKYTKQVILV